MEINKKMPKKMNKLDRFSWITSEKMSKIHWFICLSQDNIRNLIFNWSAIKFKTHYDEFDKNKEETDLYKIDCFNKSWDIY